MNDPACSYEREVEQASLKGNYDNRLRAHIRDCPICRDIILVSTHLQNLAETPQQQPALPNAAYIWWRARLLQRRKSEKRITRLITITRILAYLVLIFGSGGWLFHKWFQERIGIENYFRSLLSWSIPGLVSNIGPLIYLTIVLLVLNTALTLKTVLKKDRV